MTLLELAKLTQEEARLYLEGLRWPDGPICPHCGHYETIYRLNGKSHRKGLLKCGACREPFSVTVGTVMEASRIPIVKWLIAFHLMSSSKKGFSAHQLHRTIGVTYKTAWFMAHRIRYAMEQLDPEPLSGIVEVDETYVGGKPRNPGESKRGRGTKKTPVIALVERDGRARTKKLERVNGETLKAEIRAAVDKSSRIMTDENSCYTGIGAEFEGGHESTNHGNREYVRGDVHSNTVESFFGLVKRQHYGTNHHYSKKHMPRYLTETEFRWNNRKINDEARAVEAVKGIEGKRLTYRRAD